MDEGSANVDYLFTLGRVPILPWYTCPLSRGMSAHFAVESVPGLAWNLHPGSGQGSSGASGGAGGANFRQDGAISDELADRLRSEIGANEHLIWVGRPETRIQMARNIPMLIVGLIAVGGGIAYLVLFRQDIIGAVIILIGLLIAAFSLSMARAADNTCYALTNKRALVLKKGLFGPQREEYGPELVAGMDRVDAAGFAGCGDLVFQTFTVVRKETTRRNGVDITSTSKSTIRLGFLAIQNIDDIERLIREKFIAKLSG